MNLKEQVMAYLDANGISVKYFAKYIGCDSSNTSKWLHDKYDINKRQIDRAYKFIQGDHLITMDEIKQRMEQ